MATLAQFAKKMREQAKGVPINVRDMKRVVGARVLQGVVLTTPIDTGRARFNWNVSFNRPDHTVDSVDFDGYGRRSAWSSKMSSSLMTVARAAFNDTIYISNALPYIQQLNDGWSKQAPKDYVRVAALIAARSVAERPILSR